MWCESPRNYALLGVLCACGVIAVVGIAVLTNIIITRANKRHRTVGSASHTRSPRASSSTHLNTSGPAPPTYEITMATPLSEPVPDNDERNRRHRRHSQSSVGSSASGTCPPPLDRFQIRRSASPLEMNFQGGPVRLPALPSTGVGPPPLPPDVLAGLSPMHALLSQRGDAAVHMMPPAWTLAPPELAPKYHATPSDAGMQRPGSSASQRRESDDASAASAPRVHEPSRLGSGQHRSIATPDADDPNARQPLASEEDTVVRNRSPPEGMRSGSPVNAQAWYPKVQAARQTPVDHGVGGAVPTSASQHPTSAQEQQRRGSPLVRSAGQTAVNRVTSGSSVSDATLRPTSAQERESSISKTASTRPPLRPLRRGSSNRVAPATSSV